MTAERFFDFCQVNRDLRIERSAQGDVLIMSPTGGRTGARNAELVMQLRQWAKANATGVAFDSSAGFTLPNGAVRSPDAAWLPRNHVAGLSDEQKEKFLPVCPDFVVELHSPSDDLQTLRAKMDEYVANGAQLGWLIDPEHRHVEVYRSGVPSQRLDNPTTLSAEPLLVGFTLDLTPIWDPNL